MQARTVKGFRVETGRRAARDRPFEVAVEDAGAARPGAGRFRRARCATGGRRWCRARRAATRSPWRTGVLEAIERVPPRRPGSDRVTARIGLIGGSGVYDLSGIDGPAGGDARDAVRQARPTPTSRGLSAASPVAFFPRHGRGHRFSPSEINYRANICGFKMLGCDAVLSASAVGSLKEAVRPAARRRPGPVHRPHAAPRRHVLRRRASWPTSRFRRPVCPAAAKALEPRRARRAA